MSGDTLEEETLRLERESSVSPTVALVDGRMKGVRALNYTFRIPLLLYLTQFPTKTFSII